MADDSMFFKDEPLDAEELFETTKAPPLPEQPFKGSLDQYIRDKFGSTEMFLRANYAITRGTPDDDQLKERAKFFNEVILDVLSQDLKSASIKVASSTLVEGVPFDLFSMATSLVLEYNRAVNRKG